MTMHQRDGGFIGLVLASAIALTACGGGGSGNGDENTTAGEDANSAPSITSQGEVSVAENTALVLDVAASDADGDALSFSLSGADASLFSIDDNGLLSFASTPNFEAPEDDGGDNVYNLVLMVSDGSASDSLAIIVTVTNDESDDFQLTASAFDTGTSIPLIHACADLGGNNYSPQLSWRNAPESTDSYALIIDDETAPCGTDANACVHWNLFNIDAAIERLVEDIDPATLTDDTGFSDVVEGLTYAGTNDYEGPCPPQGNTHTYYFVLYALSTDQPRMTRLDALTRSEFEEAYAGNVLAQATITGTFSR